MTRLTPVQGTAMDDEGVIPGGEMVVADRKARTVLIHAINRALFHAINFVDRLTRGRR